MKIPILLSVESAEIVAWAASLDVNEALSNGHVDSVDVGLFSFGTDI